MEDYQAKLFTEQFQHLRDSIESRFQRLEKELLHHAELENHKTSAIWEALAEMKREMHDHEARIRKVDDLTISNKTHTTIFQAGQAALTLIAAAIAAWLGGRA
jgi:hypothetical protein